MSQQQREALDQMMRANPFDIGGELREQRPVLEQMLTHAPLPNDVTTTMGVLGGVPVVTVTIDGQEPLGTVLYFHGGAYAMGTAAASVGLASDLARRAQMKVITVDYRLAPEHPFPAAPDDALAAYRALLEIEGDPSRIALAGESAGGNLAAVTLLAIKEAGLPQPSSALLMSPWTDLEGTGDSNRTKADLDPALTSAGMRTRAKDYLAGADPRDARVSPIYGDLSGLPPLLIQAGSNEVLLDDATRLAARAASDEVAVTLDVVPQVSHVFQAFSAMLDEAEEALTRAGAFVRGHLPKA